MMAIALAITWTVLAVYIYGILPTPRALRIIEEEEALNPHPEPEVILEADLRDPHDLRRTETHHSVRSRASAAKSHKSHNTHHEDAERLIAVGS
jgi:hypothetical protein